MPQNNKKSYETPRAEFLDNSSGNVKELINKFEQKIDGQKFNFSNQQNNNIDTGKHYEQITPSTKLGQPINGGKSVGGDLHR